MKMTAQDLERLGVIDRIVPEPVGGAHRDPADTIATLGRAIEEELDALSSESGDALRSSRRAKYLSIG